MILVTSWLGNITKSHQIQCVFLGWCWWCYRLGDTVAHRSSNPFSRWARARARFVQHELPRVFVCALSGLIRVLYYSPMAMGFCCIQFQCTSRTCWYVCLSACAQPEWYDMIWVHFHFAIIWNFLVLCNTSKPNEHMIKTCVSSFNRSSFLFLRSSSSCLILECNLMPEHRLLLHQSMLSMFKTEEKQKTANFWKVNIINKKRIGYPMLYY